MKKILLTLSLALVVTGCSGTRPELGIIDSKLRPCPTSPKCISSFAKNDKYGTSSFYFAGESVPAWQSLTAIIRDMKRAKIVSQTGTYLHVEFTSPIFRFVDDLEIRFDNKTNLVHLRSASRVGRGDMGANKNRVERIKQLYEKDTYAQQ